MCFLQSLMVNCIFLVFSYFGGKLFDSVGPTAPYMVWSAMSACYLVIGIILVMLGRGHLSMDDQKQESEKEAVGDKRDER